MFDLDWSSIFEQVAARAIVIAVIVVGAFLLIRAARLFVRGLLTAVMDREAAEGTARELTAIEVSRRIASLDALSGRVIRFFVWVIAGLMILGIFDLDIGPAVAGLGVVGVAVGFGAQHLVRDYFNGALILMENQFSKGDVIEVAGVSGTVEDFSMRRTTLRDLDGNVHTVPNGEILVSTNMTRVWGRVNEDIQVSYETDIDRVAEVIARVGEEMLADPDLRPYILEAPRLERVEALSDSGITLKVLATVRAPQRWLVAGALRRRLLSAFAAAGVEIPFPHRVIVNRPSPTTDTAGQESVAD